MWQSQRAVWRQPVCKLRVIYWSADGKPISAAEFLKRLFGDLSDMIADEDQLRAVWADPDTRESFLERLEDHGYDRGRLDDIRRSSTRRTATCSTCSATCCSPIRRGPATNAPTMCGGTVSKRSMGTEGAAAWHPSGIRGPGRRRARDAQARIVPHGALRRRRREPGPARQPFRRADRLPADAEEPLRELTGPVLGLARSPAALDPGSRPGVTGLGLAGLRIPLRADVRFPR